jgi:hypothetical protein
MEMGWKRIAALGMALMIPLSACTAESTADASKSPPPEQTIVATPESDPIKDNITATFSSFCDPAFIESSIFGDMTTVNIYDPDIAAPIQEAKDAGVVPTNWEDIKTTLVGLSENTPLLQDTTRCAIYLRQSEDGEIYLTVTGDKVMFDVFEEAATYNDGKISLDEFNQIKTGMTYDEVVSIIGSKGELLSESDLGIGSEYVTTMWMWEGKGSIGANANVMFQDGKVVNKAQFGLE